MRQGARECVYLSAYPQFAYISICSQFFLQLFFLSLSLSLSIYIYIIYIIYI